jgi:hypothetical protein
VALLATLLGILSGTVYAGPAAAAVPRTIIFPVVGTVSYENDFGDPRGQGSHQGNDLMADWRAPAVAVEPGTVRIWTRSASAGCMLYLYGKSGTTYLYIHLNNDLGPDNDNKGKCKPGTAYAPGLRDGQTVRAGQLVGYVGDSGDANGVGHHLHFELHPNDGRAVSPFKWLRRAERLLFSLSEPELARAAAAAPTLSLTGKVRSVEPGAEGEPGLLTIAVTKVVLSTGGTWAVERQVTLTVPAEATFERAGQAARKRLELADLEPGAKIQVWTPELELSLETQRARPGVLAAARVRVRG